MNKKTLGVWGEKIAEKYLRNKGYQILDKNYSFRISGHCQKGEIDLVAKKEEVISFIEVKSSMFSNDKTKVVLEFFLPESRVNFSKQKKLIKTAESWLIKNKMPKNQRWQIDVISIKIDSHNKKAKIRHFQNAIFGKC